MTNTTDTDIAPLTIDGAIATLKLNRPEKRNALSLDLLGALRERVAQLAAMPDDDRPSVLVLTGEGKSFCAGMDLKAVLKEPGAPLRLLQSIAELTIAIRELPMVVLGRVNGAAIGGGCGLVAVCDLAITTPDAKLGYPEVDLGVCPAVVAPWLVAAVGGSTARRILLSGGTMSGLQAFQFGLVTEIVPAAELDDRVRAVAEGLAKAGPHALSQTKKLLNEIDQGGENERLYALVRKGAHLSAEVIGGEEAQRRLSAIYG
ncbi:MAG: enoyl-CoA hydratase/isomerase family protein [Phycisphaerales bacterium JB050]